MSLGRRLVVLGFAVLTAACSGQPVAHVTGTLRMTGGPSGATQPGVPGHVAAVAGWHRPDGMRVETHVRESLGIVRYLWHDVALEHRDYLRVKRVRGAYPGFSDSPSEAFQHLLTDLQGPASDLLSMSETEFPCGRGGGAPVAETRVAVTTAMCRYPNENLGSSVLRSACCQRLSRGHQPW